MKKLPIGIQSFSKIRSDNYYYVDKTFFIEKLVQEGGTYYFLSRPRRFGKSLFLDTLRQAFLGRKQYFNGLYLENKWDWDRVYPVIKISLGSGVVEDRENLRDVLFSSVDEIAEDEEITLKEKIINKRFYELIKKMYKKYDTGVVVLVDEYDKPILDRIEDKEKAIEIREELKNFYSVLKDADEYIKFVFITGVTKFSKVSIFSGLNQLQDITLNPEYATICGYTQKEFEDVFFERLQGMDLETIQKWYNGYSWLGDKVYNPFDVLLFFAEKDFRPYWFETGTPSFLIKLIADRKYYIPKLENLEVGEELLGAFDIDRIYPENLLFQSGYLTIRNKQKTLAGNLYLLSFPNHEVKVSFNNHILTYLVDDYYEKQQVKLHLYKAIDTNNFDKLKKIFVSFFSSIPYDWYRKNNLAGYEGYYASIFYCYFTATGFFVIAEDVTNHGKIDLTVFYKDRIYIIEFKVVELIKENIRPIDQIKKKKYYEKYKNQYNKIYLIGVEFSKDERNIVGWEVEKLN